jgi:hypothetical protein
MSLSLFLSRLPFHLYPQTFPSYPIPYPAKLLMRHSEVSLIPPLRDVFAPKKKKKEVAKGTNADEGSDGGGRRRQEEEDFYSRLYSGKGPKGKRG